MTLAATPKTSEFTVAMLERLLTPDRRVVGEGDAGVGLEALDDQPAQREKHEHGQGGRDDRPQQLRHHPPNSSENFSRSSGSIRATSLGSATSSFSVLGCGYLLGYLIFGSLRAESRPAST